MMFKDLKKQWDEEGYIVVRNVFDVNRVTRLMAICDDIFHQWRLNDPAKDDQIQDYSTTACSMRHINHPAYFKNHPEWFPDVMDAVADPMVLDICRAILGEEPLFRCTTLWFDSENMDSPGNWHRDSQFSILDENEEKKKVLASNGQGGIQMQIALVPSDHVEYVPKSHLRWDSDDEYRIRLADGKKNNTSDEMPRAIKPQPNPGDAALFNPTGLHRGCYLKSKLRRTLMFTYTRTSKTLLDHFSRQPWFLEPGHLEGLKPESQAFFQKFIEAYRECFEQSLSA